MISVDMIFNHLFAKLNINALCKNYKYRSLLVFPTHLLSLHTATVNLLTQLSIFFIYTVLKKDSFKPIHC